MKNKKLKIFFDANPLTINKTGVGYYTYGMVSSLSEVGGKDIELVGHYFNFLGRKKSLHLPKADNIRYVQTKVFPGKLLSVCRRFGFQLPLEWITKERGDMFLFTNFVSLPSIFKTKKIAVMHDVGFIDHPEFVAVKNLNFLNRWVPRTVKSSDLIVTISKFSAERLKQTYGLDDNRLFITPIPPLKDQSSNTPSSLNRFKIPTNKYVLFIGTLEPRKNLVTLLEAYERLDNTFKNRFSLVLAGGTGWKDEVIKQKIEDMQASGNNVVTTGYVSDKEKSALYKGASFCVQPSIYEGFGMPILEAMSYGKAVVCSDIEVFREVAGNAARYFSPINVTDLKNTLESLINNPGLVQDMGVNGKKRVEQYPNWEVVSSNLLERLRGL